MSLFQAIQGFVKFEEKMRVGRIHKSWWLLHINIFNNRTMKKGIVYINLFDRPVKMESNGEKNFDGNWFGHRIESFFIVKTL